MERTDIFKQILETENKAKNLREEAEQRQLGLDKYIAEKEAAYRAKLYSAADAEIAAAEQKQHEYVEAEIQKLKEKNKRDILNIHISFEKKMDEWVEKLFEIVVGNA